MCQLVRDDSNRGSQLYDVHLKHHYSWSTGNLIISFVYHSSQVIFSLDIYIYIGNLLISFVFTILDVCSEVPGTF